MGAGDRMPLAAASLQLSCGIIGLRTELRGTLE